MGSAASRFCQLWFLASAIALCLQPLASGEDLRVWSSRDGKFKVDAQLVGADDNKATLKTDDNRVVTVALDRLDEEDVAYVKQWLVAQEKSIAAEPIPGLIPDVLGEPVDLLAKIDPYENAYRGAWERQGADLVCDTQFRSMIEVPFRPPPQYQLKMEATPGGSFSITLAIDGNWGLLVFDGIHETGMVWIDEKNEPNNVTYFRNPVIKKGKPAEIVCTVHRRHLHVSWNGKTIVDFSGDPARVGLHARYWPREMSDRFVISSQRSELRVSKYELTPILQSEWDNYPRPTSSETPADSLALIEHPLGTGSGFLISPWMLVTNSHVIDSAPVKDLKVVFPKQSKPLNVKGILYEDPQRDLAILSVETARTPFPLAFDGHFPKEKSVRLLGNPSIEGGVVLRNASVTGTAKATVRVGRFDFFQIDADINPGSSGGPILNNLGQVIGVATLKATKEGETIIREGLQRLDDSLGNSSQEATQKGVAFGVPSYDLAAAFDTAISQSPEEVTGLVQLHDARVVYQRLMIIAGNRLLHALASVPDEMYANAIKVRLAGRVKSEELVALIAPEDAHKLKNALESREITSRISLLSEGNADLVRGLQATRFVDRTVIRDLQRLLRKTAELEKLAQRPGSDYVRFSSVVLRIQRELRELRAGIEAELGSS